jgi:aspartate/methionine/tyrosine aminotransferase
VLEDEQFRAIVEICEDTGILLISDEAYERITFDGFKHKSAIDFDYENTVVVNSTSKSLCMTGLRVGYTISRNPELMKPIIQLHQYNTAHAAVPMQYGALAGFEHEDAILNRIVTELQSRRDTLVDSWKGIPGMEFEKPKGTFYLYPDISETGMSASEFTEFALRQGVVLTPGNSFCFNKEAPAGSNHVRIAYGVTSEEEIRQAGQILKEALADQ